MALFASALALRHPALRRVRHPHHRRLLLALALALALARHRRALLSRLRASLRAARAAASTLSSAAAVLSCAARHLHFALAAAQPLPPSLTMQSVADLPDLDLREPSSPEPTSPDSTPRQRRRRKQDGPCNQPQDGWQVLHPAHRLAALAASPPGLAIARAAAQGAASAFATPGSPPACGNACDGGGGVGGGGGARAVVDALASREGLRVVDAAVSAAVREALRGRAADSSGPSAGADWQDAALRAASSDGARKMFVDVAKGVAEVAVPLLAVQRHAAPAGVDRCDGVASRRASIAGVPSFAASSPSPASSTCAPASASAAGTPGARRPLSLWERLAVLAVRDRVLVRDVVSAVVGQAVRTYLMTQAELGAAREGGGDRVSDDGALVAVDCNGKAKKRATEAGGVADNDGAAGGGGGGATNAAVVPSLWRVIARSVVVDLKRAVRRAGSAPGSNGWTVF